MSDGFPPGFFDRADPTADDDEAVPRAEPVLRAQPIPPTYSAPTPRTIVVPQATPRPTIPRAGLPSRRDMIVPRAEPVDPRQVPRETPPRRAVPVTPADEEEGNE